MKRVSAKRVASVARSRDHALVSGVKTTTTGVLGANRVASPEGELRTLEEGRRG